MGFIVAPFSILSVIMSLSMQTTANGVVDCSYGESDVVDQLLEAILLAVCGFVGYYSWSVILGWSARRSEHLTSHVVHFNECSDDDDDDLCEDRQLSMVARPQESSASSRGFKVTRGHIHVLSRQMALA